MAVFDTLRAARTLKAAGFGDVKAEAVAEIVQAVANGNRVTKADMRGFATKADFDQFAGTLDLDRFATKVDLERFATKADLKRFATKADLEPLVTRAEFKSDLQELELRLTIRMGVLAASAVTIGVALMVALNQLLL